MLPMVRLGYLGLPLIFLACGGKAVIDAPLGAGGSSASTGTMTTATGVPPDSTTATATTSGSGVSDCREAGCKDGYVCHQASGVCIAKCDSAAPSCKQGTACDACPTASCPTCKDCVAACMPTNGGKLCNDHPNCPDTDVCVFSTNLCAKRCGTGDPADVCPTGVCQQCLTSSCPTCDDCVSACTELVPGG
jgi:hypothetical protein